ncbi:MAG: hypothetical protein ACM3SY_18010 [Candidatus Omnitrophota bacterium]
MKKSTIIFTLILVMSMFCFVQGQQNNGQLPDQKIGESPSYEIALDFLTSAILPYGAVELGDGEILEIRILNLPEGDIEISVNGVLKEKVNKGDIVRGLNQLPIQIRHRSEMALYQVHVSATSDNVTKKRDWVIPVMTTQWTVDFSGAFTVDTLGTPSYYLKPTIRKDPITQTEENGFLVQKDEDSSQLGIGTVAMVHLYYNSRQSKLKFIPVTFGVGIGIGTDIRYYIGPSLRFGGVGFLTGGLVLGDVNRPPASSPPGSFVTDANALENMAKKKKIGIFVGFSYSFTGSNSRQRLQEPFALPSTTEQNKK